MKRKIKQENKAIPILSRRRGAAYKLHVQLAQTVSWICTKPNITVDALARSNWCLQKHQLFFYFVDEEIRGP